MNIQFNTPSINQNNFISRKIKTNKKICQQNTMSTNNLTYYYPQVIFRATPSKALNEIGKASLEASSELIEEWRLFDEKVFSTFIMEHGDLKKILGKDLEKLMQYGLKPNIQFFRKIQEHCPGIKSFFEMLGTKYGIKLETSPKLYRFVGKSEVDELLKGRMLYPQRYSDRFDVTINPDLNWNKYRITFKDKPKFSVWQTEQERLVSENTGYNKGYYYHLRSPYSIDDVEKIEIITPNGYEEVSF